MASRIYERVMVTRPLSVSEDVAPSVDPVAVVDGVAGVVLVVVVVVLAVVVVVVVVVLVVGTSAGRSIRSISVRQPRRLCK